MTILTYKLIGLVYSSYALEAVEVGLLILLVVWKLKRKILFLLLAAPFAAVTLSLFIFDSTLVNLLQHFILNIAASLVC